VTRLVWKNESLFWNGESERDGLAIPVQFESVVRAALWGDGKIEVSGNGLSQIPFGKRLIAEFIFHDASTSTHAFLRRIRIGSYSYSDSGTPRANSDSKSGTDASPRGSAGKVGDDVFRSGGKESLIFRTDTEGEVLSAEIDVLCAGGKDSYFNDYIALAERRAEFALNLFGGEQLSPDRKLGQWARDRIGSSVGAGRNAGRHLKPPPGRTLAGVRRGGR